ncbi:MAG: hypothetical protein LBS96_04495 [Oscillospiraceae bacterium]|jgi:hypothetical protein|nr:hypothetical protein [Oscillospiraceae bacterium]
MTNEITTSADLNILDRTLLATHFAAAAEEFAELETLIDEQKKPDRYTNGGLMLGTGVLSISMFLGVLIVFGVDAFDDDDGSAIVALGLAALVGIGLFAWGLYRIPRHKAHKARSIQLASDLRAKMSVAKYLDFVPKEYYSSFACDYFATRLRNGVATTWRECVSDYEAQVSRWKIEQNTAEAAEWAKAAARSASSAATAAWASRW